MAHKIVGISSQYNMPECVMLIALAKIPAGKRCDFSHQLALNKTFCSTTPPLTHRRLKRCQRININKTMYSASPSLVFYTKFTIPELKSK